MRTLALLCVLSLPAPAEPLALAAPELSVMDLSAERSTFYTEALASSLTRAGVRVTTAKAIAQLLGVERQKQLMGCAGGDSCVAEIAAALGTHGVVFGQVGRLDDGFRLDLKVISAKDARIVSTFSQRADSEGELLDVMDQAARVLAADAARELDKELTPRAPPARSVMAPVGYAVGGVGVASVIAGTVLLLQAKSRADAIPAPGSGVPPLAVSDAEALASQGKTFQTAGWACVIAGGALVAAGATLAVLGSREAPTVSLGVDPSSGAAALVVSGRF